LATTEYVDRADDLKANLASPIFTGAPSMPTGTTGVTQAISDNSTKIATTAFVKSKMEATTVTIGTDGTTKGNGVRIGNARFTINKPSEPTSSSSDTDLSISQVLEEGIFVGTSTSSNKTIKIPTAKGSTGLVQALPNAEVGDIVSVLIVNGGNKSLLIDGRDSSVTKVPSTMTVPAGTSRLVYIRVTSITSGSETVSIY
jgi:hypothetical protein